ncbi:beta-lactamase [Carbonactinospora thermoautotrophica]|uniref:Beta-lactamase n=1 Tax=Carbonactinospora thermoautotrophica TaxID=1469144 RepID=A0A132MLZ7_9ACTN|nr:MBL fold metallo-hydrolase [Carbonactinospora thermoautotrophica]KWW97475.1 beta-lactamase [Carbonactinospora thermoautotrophica]KWW98755.1 Zn-dependent hydrolase of the beta-lactamase fold-like protein [Carbonactinospora thermoautotrophica]KWX07829.1 beta-lactamase [Carbonactinospora thermoautotrophica]
MRLTKLEHACVRLEKDGATLVIDPGVWSGPEALSGADAVLVTHEHFDHLDADRLRAAMSENPGLRLRTNASVAEWFADFGDRVRAVRHGDTFTCAGFDVHVYGEKHALLHRDVPVVANTGFLIDGEVFHPGDALTVPEDPVATLLLPANAPWLKVSEMVDYAREVAPQRAYAVHDGLLNANGLAVLANWLRIAAEPTGATFTRLEPGTSVDL